MANRTPSKKPYRCQDCGAAFYTDNHCPRCTGIPAGYNGYKLARRDIERCQQPIATIREIETSVGRRGKSAEMT